MLRRLVSTKATREIKQKRIVELAESITLRVQEDSANFALSPSPLVALLRQPEKRRDLSMRLEHMVTAELQRICRASGIHVYQQKKDGILTLLTKRISLICDQSNSAVFIDVGIKNIAWVHFDMAELAVLNFGSDNLADFGSVAHVSGPEYAHAVSAYLRSVKLRCSLCPGVPELFVVEQQMSRHNPKCALVEAQLHAFLYPNSLSVSPSSVSAYFGISSVPRQIALSTAAVKDSGDAEEKPVSMAVRYSLKKKFAVHLVDSWLTSKTVIKPNEALSQFYEATTKERRQRSLSKKDDLSDCILNAVAFSMWTRKFNDKIFSLLK